MKTFRTLVLAFVFGGLTAVVAQGFFALWVSLIGPSIFATLLALACLGVIGALLIILGIFPKLEELSGFGVGFSFGGFAAAVAGIYAGTKSKTGSDAEALKAAAGVVVLVIGTGVLLSFIVAAVSFFAKKGGL
jgi:hypothetical protein